MCVASKVDNRGDVTESELNKSMIVQLMQSESLSPILFLSTSFHFHLLRVQHVSVLLVVVRKFRFLPIINRIRSSFPSSPCDPLTRLFDVLGTSTSISRGPRLRRRSSDDSFGSVCSRVIVEVLARRRRRSSVHPRGAADFGRDGRERERDGCSSSLRRSFGKSGGNLRSRECGVRGE